MGFNYNAKDAVQCLPEGDYDATIVSAEEAKAKTGAQMIVVKYKVYTPDGREVPLTDRIVLPAFTWKLKKIAKAIGKADKFEDGTLGPDDLFNENVKLSLKVEEQQGYEPQNQIKSIGSSSLAVSRPTRATTAAPMTEDDIPFS